MIIKPKNYIGDMNSMVFGDYFDRFISDRSFHKDLSDKISITKEEYKILQEKAEKIKALSDQAETLRLENKELKDVIKEIKEDGRHYKELKEENEKFMHALLKVRADFENYKKINERENQRYKVYISEGILKKLIVHFDDLKRALKVIETLEDGGSVKKGFEMVIKNFEKLLEEEGVKSMNCEGEKFDPYKHEALMVQKNEALPENTIVEELDQGYLFKDKVLRPAKVLISKKSN